jgi:hypothetical protein
VERAREGDRAATVTELVGVYDARGTLGAELAYWVGARLGRRHCALCDITHGSVREKSEWRAARAALPVPFPTVHLDEQDQDVAACSAGRTPCVVARTTAGLRLLLGPEELATCGGSPAALVAAVERAVVVAALGWPPG